MKKIFYFMSDAFIFMFGILLSSAQPQLSLWYRVEWPGYVYLCLFIFCLMTYAEFRSISKVLKREQNLIAKARICKAWSKIFFVFAAYSLGGFSPLSNVFNMEYEPGYITLICLSLSVSFFWLFMKAGDGYNPICKTEIETT